MVKLQLVFISHIMLSTQYFLTMGLIVTQFDTVVATREETFRSCSQGQIASLLIIFFVVVNNYFLLQIARSRSNLRLIDICLVSYLANQIGGTIMLILIKSQVIVQGHASSLFLIVEMRDLQKPLPISRPCSADYILSWHLICLHVTTKLINASLYMYIFNFLIFALEGIYVSQTFLMSCFAYAFKKLLYKANLVEIPLYCQTILIS